MAKWVESINLMGVLDQFDTSDLDDGDELPAGLVDAVKKEVLKSNILSRHHVFGWIDDCETIGDFNNWLHHLYNLADLKRVWTSGGPI